jgi:hypothetical protein
MTKSQEPLKPGDRTPHSGKYEQVGPRGGRTGETAVSVEGRPLPPTDDPGNSWVLVDPSGK